MLLQCDRTSTYNQSCDIVLFCLGSHTRRTSKAKLCVITVSLSILTTPVPVAINSVSLAGWSIAKLLKLASQWNVRSMAWIMPALNFLHIFHELVKGLCLRWEPMQLVAVNRNISCVPPFPLECFKNQWIIRHEIDWPWIRNCLAKLFNFSFQELFERARWRANAVWKLAMNLTVVHTI